MFASILLSLAWLSSQARSQEPAVVHEVREQRNVAYRSAEKGEILPIHNVLDLYLPKNVKDFPVIFLVHGGAWVAGDKTLDFVPDVARMFARQGLGVVAPNYRLAPLAPYPAQLRDVAKALAWTVKHIGDYGGQPDRMVLMGHSAGGHLVSMLATDEGCLTKEGLNGNCIRAVVSVSGVYQISDVCLDILFKAGQVQKDLTLTANPYRIVFGKDAEIRRQASPLTHVREGLPPFAIVSAERDLPTLADMARDFDVALRGKKCTSMLVSVPDCNHLTVFWRLRKPGDPVAVALLQFIKQHAGSDRAVSR